MLQVDDLAVGLYVTVLSNVPISPMPSLGGLFGGNDASTTTTWEDRSGMGDIMAIASIDLPYVVTKPLNEHCLGGYPPTTRDTRRTTFMAVTPAFLEASEEKRSRP